MMIGSSWSGDRLRRLCRAFDGGDPEIADPANPNHYVPAPQASWWYNAFHQNPKDLPINPADGTTYRVWTIYATFNSVPIGNCPERLSRVCLGLVRAA